MNDEPEIPFEALEPEPAWEAIGNRVCDDPVPIGRLVSMIAEPLMRGHKAIDESKHPYEGNCRQCGLPLDVRWIQLERCEGWFPVNIHEGACKEAYYAQTGVAGLQAEMWQKICPPDFRAAWDPRKGNAGLLKRVLAYDPKLGRGLLILGPSGAGKTRCAWALVKQIMDGGMPVTFMASIDLPDENQREMIHAPCLVIDDLGNDKMQGNRETIVLKILRSRMDWKKPTIITTQFNGERLMERFSDGHTAQAIVRRLRESFDNVQA